jgi:hypothetical protein
MVWPLGTPFVDPEYTASDPADANIQNEVSVSGNVNTNTTGTYTLIYIATDSQSVVSPAVTRTVDVVAPTTTQ